MSMTTATVIQPSSRNVSGFLATERGAHRALAATRCMGYVERNDLLARLDRFADGRQRPAGANLLVIHGESGSGKSSLLSYWSTRRGRHATAGFLVEHYVGATGSSGDHTEIIRRVILEIRERYGIRDEVPATRSRLEDELPRWLGQVQNEDLCLVIDAVDQLDPLSRSLAWLPGYLQPRVRVVVSTARSEQVAQLVARGAEELVVEALSRTDRIEIARKHVASRRGQLTSAQVRRVASAPGSSNPLFLRTSLEEARSHAAGESADDRIGYYLAATGLHDLYTRLLIRVEEEHETELLAEVLGLLWATRIGLTLDDLAAITGRAEELRRLMLRLDFFLSNRGGVLTILHDEFRSAVDARYLSTEEARRRQHARLAAHFGHRAQTARSVAERVWQLSRADDRVALAGEITNLETFQALFARDEGLELMGYVIQLAGEFDAEIAFIGAFEEFTHRSQPGRWSSIGNDLGAFLQLGGYLRAAETVLARLIAKLNERGAVPDAQMARALMQIGQSRQGLGDLVQARRDLFSALEIVDGLDASLPEDRVRIRCAVADLLYARGEFAESRRVLAEAGELAEQNLGVDHSISLDVLVDLGAVVAALGDNLDAEAILRRALATSERIHGSSHPKTAQVLNNVASVITSQQRHDEAVELLQRAAEINRRALGPTSGELAANYVNLGRLRARTGDHVQAETEYRRALAIYDTSGRSGCLDAATALFNLGQLLHRQSRYAESIEMAQRAYEVRRSLLGDEHHDVLWAARVVTLSAWADGDFTTAERWGMLRDKAMRRSAPGTHEADVAALDLQRIIARQTYAR